MSTHETKHGPAAPPEPKTPLWLPALGAALFLLVGIWWATRPTPPPTASAAPDADASADAGAAPAAKN